MRRLRVGCVGTGFIASWHLKRLARFDEVEVVAVADVMPSRAKATASEYDARAHDDGLAMLEEEGLDAVWLCVPPYAHGPLEAAAIDRGLPFFVEKPIALDLQGAVQVAAGVERVGLATAVGYHWRHVAVVEEAAMRLRDAPARLVTGSWLDATPAVEWWWRRDRSGGQLVEQTTHIFDLLRVLVGEVASVTAVESSVTREGFAGADVPTASAVSVVFANGAIGTVSSTCLLPGRHRVGVSLMGEGLVVELSEGSLADHRLQIVDASGETVTDSDQDPIEAEDRDFVDVLLGRREQSKVPYAEALRTQALVCAADRSAREAATVDLAGELSDE